MIYALLFMAGLVAGLLFFGARRYSWPSGPRIVYYSWSSRVIAVCGARSHLFALAVHSAVEAAEFAGIAWSKSHPFSRARLPRVYGIYFMDDLCFETIGVMHKRFTHHDDSAVLYIRNLLGCKAPLFVIKTSAMQKVVDTGQPMIHQMLHYLLEESGDGDGDAAHTSMTVWKDVTKPGINTLEDVVQLLHTEDMCRSRLDTSCSESPTKAS